MPLAALPLATLPLLLLLLVLLRNVVSDYSKLREVPGPQSICSLKTLLFGLFGDGTLGKHGLVARHRAYEEAQGEHRLVRIIIWPLLSRLQFFLCDPDEPVPRWMNKVDSLREPKMWAAIRLDKSIFALPLGEDWGRHRKLIAPLFSTRSLTEFLPTIHATSRALLLTWMEAAGSGSCCCELHAALSAWSLDIIGRIVFGHDFGAVRELAGKEAVGSCGAVTSGARCADNTANVEGKGSARGRMSFAGAVSTLLPALVRYFRLGRLRHLDRATTRREHEASELLRRTAREVMETSRRSAQGAEGATDAHPTSTSPAETSSAAQSFVAKLTAAQDKETGARLSQEEVIQDVGALLVAGHETSSNTCCWALHLLATHPATQQACREQVDAAWAKDGGAPSFETLFGCDLLLGAIYEALRLFPTVPFTPKLLDADREVGGVWLRKGTRVSVNKAAVGKSSAHFTDPDAFDPTRFARNEYGTHGAKLHAFGSGPRVCVGLRLAELEMLSLLAHVLRHFRLAPAAGAPPPQEYLDITVGPKLSGLRLELMPCEGRTLQPPGPASVPLASTVNTP